MSRGAKQTAKAEQILQGAMQEFLQHGSDCSNRRRIEGNALHWTFEYAKTQKLEGSARRNN